MSVCMYVCLSACLSVYLFVCLSVYLFVCLSVCRSVGLSVCLPAWLSLCLSGKPWVPQDISSESWCVPLTPHLLWGRKGAGYASML